MSTVAVLQSNYIPWKGYFDIIHDADFFIFHDDLQFTKNDWRNRNKIKTSLGSSWLSIPVGTREDRLICEVVLPDAKWQKSHWNNLKQQYGKSAHFKLYRAFLEDVYLGRQWTNLSELNQYLIKRISNDFLQIPTQFVDSREFDLAGQKQDRLLDLIVQSKAMRYVSGPAAKNYIDPARFHALGIELIWKDYAGYPEYGQFHPPFEHGVSILDLLFHTGPDAAWYVWGWRTSPEK